MKKRGRKSLPPAMKKQKLTVRIDPVLRTRLAQEKNQTATIEKALERFFRLRK